MARPATRCNGFTLIEMMIAILIIMVSMLALITAIATTIKVNVGNEARNAAVRLTNQTAEALLSLPLDDSELATSPTATHTRILNDATQSRKGIPDLAVQLRNATLTYAISWQIIPQTANTKQINIQVSYTLANKTYTNYAVTYKYQAL